MTESAPPRTLLPKRSIRCSSVWPYPILPGLTLLFAKKFTPIVDIVEDAVKKLHSKNGDQDINLATAENKFQFQRAYALSRDLREQLTRYSVEQFKQIESQNALVYV